MQVMTMPLTDHRCIEWLRPLETPALRRGDLHLWRVDLELMGQTPPLEQILSPDERIRSDCLLSSEKRASFTAGRAALRLILAKYLKVNPGEIRFKYSGKGKPSLTGSNHTSDFRFNVSHSGRWMILGVCKNAELGVDIEGVRPVQKTWALEKLFTEDDREHFAGLPENEKEAMFIAAWTEMESAAKVNGDGVSGVRSARPKDADAIREFAQDGFTFLRKDPCWFLRFEPVPGYLGCAAVQTDQRPRVKCFVFQPRDHTGNTPREMKLLIDGEG
jgi:4'-phosphopantetheinyl transferase